MLPFLRRRGRSKKWNGTLDDSSSAPFDPHSLANKLQILALEEPAVARGIEAIVDGALDELTKLDNQQ